MRNFIRRAAFVDANALSKGREESREWSDDCILGFFEGVTAWHLYGHPGDCLDGMKRRTVMQACEFLSKDYMIFDAGVIVGMWVSNTGGFYPGGGCL